MKRKCMTLKTRLYCPNIECIASGRQNIGIGAPMIEFPVDLNHAELHCPYCAVKLTQCDGCHGLISAESLSTVPQPFSICRKCGFPNIIEESLRAVFGLPRICPLPYDSVRVLQRASQPELYAIYKRQELLGIESANETTTDEQEVVFAFPSSSPSLTAQSNSEPINPLENDRQGSNLHSRKKRPRSDIMEAQEEEKTSREHDFDNFTRQMEHGQKRAAGPDRLLTFESVSAFDGSTSSNQTPKSMNLTFGRWKSLLRVPVKSMVPVLRLQLNILSVERCVQHDKETWEAVQYTKRANRFLPVHLTLLQALYENWTEFSLAHISTSGEDANGKPKTKIGKSFFDLVSRFMEERMELLTLKSDRQNSIEPMEAILQPTYPFSVHKVGNSINLQSAILSSVVNIFKSQQDPNQVPLRSKGLSYLPLLESVGDEMRRLQIELVSVFQSKLPASTPLSSGEGSSNEARSSSVEMHIEGADQPPLAKKPPNISETASFENCTEQHKLAVLMLANLHRSISATIL